MSERTQRVNCLEVPIIVQLGEKMMLLSQVMRLGPGSIIELPKSADEKLDLLVNNKIIGQGDAVKVGENFGIEITSIGKIEDMPAEEEDESEPLGNEDIEALTSALFGG